MYSKYRKKPSLENEHEYKNYRAVYQRIHRKAKSQYYNNLFEKYATNIKETWRVLKEAIGIVKKCSFKFPDYFEEEAVTDLPNPPGGGTGDGGNHPAPPYPPEPPPKPVQI